MGMHMRPLGTTDPTDIDINIPNRVTAIQWGDGHRSLFSFDLLRKACPCAVCREGRTAAAADPFKVVTSSVRPGEVSLVDAEKVGWYALRFVWSDTHDTGIYSYEYLRSICPCDACTNAAIS
jgi:DUF971 family protein